MDRGKIKSELTYKAIRSSGAGGQHVNKVSSKVSLMFDLQNSDGLTDEEKVLLNKNIPTKLTKDGILLLSADESRSQFKNKERVTERLFELLVKNLIVPIKRKPTKPSKSALLKKAVDKIKLSEKKATRRKSDDD
jgi:ribosome-associated protein